MPKSQERRAAEERKRQKVEARLANYAPDKVSRREKRRENQRWAKKLAAMNQGLQPTTKAARSSLAHERRREREEAAIHRPITITQGCTCPRLCDVHPSGVSQPGGGESGPAVPQPSAERVTDVV